MDLFQNLDQAQQLVVGIVVPVGVVLVVGTVAIAWIRSRAPASQKRDEDSQERRG
jgi:hypothetical protein